VTSRCRVLLEPVLADRDPEIESMGARQEPEPSVAAIKMGVTAAARRWPAACTWRGLSPGMS
jgi:hypothetical protein